MEVPDGYVLRPAAPDDSNELARLFAAVDAAEGAEPAYTEEDLLEDWRRNTFDIGRDSWVVTHHGGHICAYGHVETRPPDLYALGWVDPAHWSRGLGTYLVAAMEGRAAEIAGLSDGRITAVRNVISAKDQAARDILMRSAYRLVRHFWVMTIHLAATPDDIDAPSGISIRPFEISDARSVHAVLAEAFKEHWGSPFPEFDEWWSGWTARATFDPGLSLVARHGDDAVGGLTGDVSGEQGWVSDLGVLEAFRGRGIAAALLRLCFAEFQRRGFTRVALSVDAANETGATALYERVVMTRTQQFDFYEKALPVSSTGVPSQSYPCALNSPKRLP